MPSFRTICLLLCSVALHMAAVPVSAQQSVFLVRVGLIGGLVGLNIDPSALWGQCSKNGGVPVRVVSQEYQNAVEELLSREGVDEAFIGAYYKGGDVDQYWMWMGDDWSSSTWFFAEGYISSSSLAYTHWAPGYPDPVVDTDFAPTSRFVAQSMPKGGWVNKQDNGLRPYNVVCDASPVTPPSPISTSSTRTPEEEKKGDKASSSGGLPSWAVPVIVVCVLLAVGVVVVVLVCCCCCRSEAEDDEESDDDTTPDSKRPSSSRSVDYSSERSFSE